jgi:MoaD family protein
VAETQQLARIYRLLKIKVRFLGPVRDAAGTSEDTVDIRGSTIGDVIDALVVKDGDKFRQEIFQPDGNIKQSVKVFLNGKNVDYVTSLQHSVKEGDTLAIFPPFYGG